MKCGGGREPLVNNVALNDNTCSGRVASFKEMPLNENAINQWMCWLVLILNKSALSGFLLGACWIE